MLLVGARRALLKPRGAGVVSYAAYQAAMAAKATQGAVLGNAPVSAGGAYRATLNSVSAPTMTGSCWNGRYFSYGAGGETRFQGVACHALPSQSVYDAQRAAGREVYLEVQGQSTDVLPGYDRNGFLSNEDLSGSLFRARCLLFIYYDPVAGPMQMNPFAGTGPTPYTL